MNQTGTAIPIPIPTKFTMRHTEPFPGLEDEIARGAEKLSKLEARISHCDVLVEAPGPHHRRGGTWKVRIDLAIPGREIVIDREPDIDPYVAVRRAFLAAGRRIQTIRKSRLARRSK